MPKCFAIARETTAPATAPLKTSHRPSTPPTMKIYQTTKLATRVNSSPIKQLERRGKFKRDNSNLYRHTLRSNFIKKFVQMMGATASMRDQMKILPTKKETKADPRVALQAKANPSEGRKTDGACRSSQIRAKRVAKIILLRARSMERVKIHRANVAPIITGGNNVMTVQVPAGPPKPPVTLKPSVVGGIRLEKPSVKLYRPSVKLDHPYVRLDKPSVRLDKPSVSLDKPSARLDKPSVSLDKPSVSLEKPSVKLEKPSVSLDKPSVRLEMPSVKLVSLDKLRDQRSPKVEKDQEWHKTHNAEEGRLVDSRMLDAAQTLLKLSDAVLAAFEGAPRPPTQLSNDEALKALLPGSGSNILRPENEVLLPESKASIPESKAIINESKAFISENNPKENAATWVVDTPVPAAGKPKKIVCEYDGCKYTTSRVDNYHQFHLPRHTGNYKFRCDADNGCTFRSTRRDRLRSHRAAGKKTCPRL